MFRAKKPESWRDPVGAALCCEEAGTDKACLLLVPASSQHKAAPTKDASDERYLFSARQRSPKGWVISHRGMRPFLESWAHRHTTEAAHALKATPPSVGAGDAMDGTGYAGVRG